MVASGSDTSQEPRLKIDEDVSQSSYVRENRRTVLSLDLVGLKLSSAKVAGVSVVDDVCLICLLDS